MVGILRNQHMRQQTRARQAARNRPARCRSLHDPFAASGGSASGAHGGSPEACRHVLQHLRNIFAELDVTLRRSRASRMFRHMGLGLPWQMLGQWTAGRFTIRAVGWEFGSRTLDGRAASPRRVALVANLPAAVPAVRSAAPVSPICARTASAATGSAAASDARSHSPAKAAAGEWQSVLWCSAKSSACNASRSNFLRSGSVGANMSAVCHDFRCVIGRRAKKTVKKNLVLNYRVRIPGALRSAPVNAFQQHRQLCPRQGHAPAAGLWPHETPTLQSFRK